MPIIIRFISLCFLLTGLLKAQNNVFRNYSVNNGLSSSETYNVIQDSKGYIWVCSDAGVCKYDGYSFKTYTSEHGLADNTIFNMYEDLKGRIWFYGMSKKISYYNPKTDSIISIACNEDLSKLPSASTIASLYVDENDTLFLGFTSGEIFYKIPAINHYKNKIPITFNSSGWKFYYFNQQQLFWGLNSNTKSAFNLTTTFYNSFKQKTKYHQYFGYLSSSFDRLRRAIKINDDVIFSEDNILYLQKKDTLIAIKYNEAIISLYKDKQENIWCGIKNNGVFLYKAGDFTSPPIHYLNNLSISGILEDTEGGYWFSTLEHGIYYTPSLVFQYYDQTSGLSGNKVSSIMTHGDSIICFTEDRFMNSISKKGIFIHKSISGTHSYEVDQKGDDIFISQDRSYVYNLKTRKKTFVVDKYKTGDLYTRKVFVTPEKNIYALFSGGICQINPTTGSIEKTIRNFSRTTSLYVYKNTIWFGMPQGLYCYSNGRIDTLGNTFSIFKTRVDDIVKDQYDRFWFATKGSGIIIKKGNHIIQLTVKNGLSSNLCKTLLIDSSNTVWVGTNKGISKISCIKDTSFKIENYSSIDGLVSNEINQLSISGNDIYIATSQGVIKFDKTKLSFNKTPPPIYITHFYVNEIKQNKKSNYTLSYHENFIKISYLGLSYKLPGTITYKYKLNGLDTVWKYTQNTNVQFTTLPPGEYAFIVYAINNDGIQSETPSTIYFHIATPFWKTWWFILTTISLILLFIYVLFKMRISLIKKTEEEKTTLNKKIAEVELKAIRAQMNPHFIFNAINSIQHYILSKDSDLAYRYLSKFSNLIRNVLENSKYEFISLQKEIETIELYIGIEKLRFETKFNHKIHIDSSLDAMFLSISPLLIQPYVENAIWHGLMHKKTVGQLNLYFLDEDEFIRCIIEDDGIGRKMAMHIQSNNFKKHKSMGLSLNKELLEIIGKSFNNKLNIMIYDIESEKGLACGTRVEVLIPKIKYTNYDKDNNS